VNWGVKVKILLLFPCFNQSINLIFNVA